MNIFDAAKQGDLDVLQKFQSQVNDTDSFGWTALLHAIHNDHLKAVENLIYYGAGINIKVSRMFNREFISGDGFSTIICGSTNTIGARPETKIYTPLSVSINNRLQMPFLDRNLVLYYEDDPAIPNVLIHEHVKYINTIKAILKYLGLENIFILLRGVLDENFETERLVGVIYS